MNTLNSVEILKRFHMSYSDSNNYTFNYEFYEAQTSERMRKYMAKIKKVVKLCKTHNLRARTNFRKPLLGICRVVGWCKSRYTASAGWLILKLPSTEYLLVT